MVSKWRRGRHNEAGLVGEQPNDVSSQHDHATIMPQVGEDPATGSVRPGSNICGAQGGRCCQLNSGHSPFRGRIACDYQA
jgi:hypothetical protein